MLLSDPDPSFAEKSAASEFYRDRDRGVCVANRPIIRNHPLLTDLDLQQKELGLVKVKACHSQKLCLAVISIIKEKGNFIVKNLSILALTTI